MGITLIKDYEYYFEKVVKKHAGITALKIRSFDEKMRFILKGKGEIPEDKLLELMILKSNEQLDVQNIEPGWVHISAKLYAYKIHNEAKKNRSIGDDEVNPYNGENFYSLVSSLVEKGIYHPKIKSEYSEIELKQAGELLKENFDEDFKFTYAGIKLLKERYLATDFEKNVYELPQERFMLLALQLNLYENKEVRMELVEESYWAMKNIYMVAATPTLNASGKSYGQLASCFIDVMEDDLDSIFLNNWDTARLSKGGGGISVYIGKVRAMGSWIKGFKGVASGQLPWAKQLDNTAKSVDQLGVRQGAIAVYNDLWHRDILAFLDSKLNNGDEGFKLHNLSLGVTVPDLFMKRVIKKETFTLFDPYEVKQKMGFSLEDFYDDEKLKHGAHPNKQKNAFSYHYDLCEKNPMLERKEIDALALMMQIVRVQRETGYPFMFYRDTVNRMNPNKHVEGSMVYASNLCTEIAQNISATSIKTEYVENKGGKIIVHTEREAGDFVVCNLSSINLAKAVPAEVLERLINIQVRMLDNVIDLNAERLDILQAAETTKRYRAIGLGTFGWHHLLALKEIHWESEEAVAFCDELYEKIAFYAIKASMELAKEKGAYPLFEGSEWQTGKYFERRGYTKANSKSGLDWEWLQQEVRTNGVRNGYLMAVAPNSGSANIGGSTNGIDPVFATVYAEEKKNTKEIQLAPDLTFQRLKYYKSAFAIDIDWSIKQNAKRSLHIDQGISFNLYFDKDAKASNIINAHLKTWNSGIKTSYYVRSQTTEVKQCESCAG